MTYGMLASNSCLLTDIVDQLHEEAKKVNSVKCLTRHLNKGISGKALNFCYYRLAKGIRGILAFAREGTRFCSGLSVRLTGSCACGY